MVIAWTEMGSNATSDFVPAGTGWQNYDIFTNLSVPKGAVACILMANVQDAAANTMGVRTDGSALDTRYIKLHEGEAGGAVCATMYVTVHASTGLIETYVSTTTGATFYCLGYWTGTTFTEMASDISALTASDWTAANNQKDVGALGVPDGAVCQVLCANRENGAAATIGVRTDGSALNRYLVLDEAESASAETTDAECYSICVKSHATTGIIEVYSSTTTCTHLLLGYFDTTYMDYVESAPVAGAIASASTWTDFDLTTSIAAVGDRGKQYVAEIGCGHTDTTPEHLCGARVNGSGIADRYVLIHEAEGGSGASMAVYPTSMDSGDIVEIYLDQATTEYFNFMGYHKPPVVAQTVTDTSSITDATPIRNKSPAIATDTLALADALKLNKTLITTDFLSFYPMGVEQDVVYAHKTLYPTDTLSLAEALYAHKGISPTDAIALAEAVEKYAELLKEVTDALALADSALTDIQFLVDGPTLVRACNFANGVVGPAIQKGIFRMAGRWWIFFWDQYDGTSWDIYYTSSLDGISWATRTAYTSDYYGLNGRDYKLSISCDKDGGYVRVTRADWGNSSILCCRGTPNSNGTITWGTEYEYSGGGSLVSYPVAGFDTTPLGWFGAILNAGVSYYPYVVKNAASDYSGAFTAYTPGAEADATYTKMLTDGASYVAIWADNTNAAGSKEIKTRYMDLAFAWQGSVSAGVSDLYDVAAWDAVLSTSYKWVAWMSGDATSGDLKLIAYNTALGWGWNDDTLGWQTTPITIATGVTGSTRAVALVTYNWTDRVFIFWTDGRYIWGTSVTRLHPGDVPPPTLLADRGAGVNVYGLCAGAEQRFTDVMTTGKTIGLTWGENTDDLYAMLVSFESKRMTVTDEATIADLIEVLKTLPVIDALSLADVLITVKGMSVTDALALADALLTHKTLFPTDALALAEVLLLNKTLLPTDALTLADALLLNKTLLTTDALTFFDQEVIRAHKTLPITDVVTLAVELIVKGVSMSITDALALAEAMLTHKTMALTETASLAEGTLFDKTLLSSETISSVDAASTPLKEVFPSDTLSLTDSTLFGKSLIATDVITLAENELAGKGVIITDEGTLTEVAFFDKTIYIEDTLTDILETIIVTEIGPTIEVFVYDEIDLTCMEL